MNVGPTLCVVIPVYNGADYIQRCLESVFNQSLKDVHVVVVDDCSNDKTVEIVTQYKHLHSNLTIITHSKNMGTGVARNTGLSLAKSKYIAFLDSDDWMDTNAYLKMVDTLENTSADIALCGIRTEYSNSLLSTLRYHYPHSNLISADFALSLLSQTEMQDAFISPMVGNKVFRLDFLNKYKLRFPERSLFEDDEFMFLALCHANSVALVPDTYQHYYQRESSAMHTFSNKSTDCLLQTFIGIRDHLSCNGIFSTHKNQYYSFLDRCLSSLLDTMFSCEQSVAAQRKHLVYLLDRLFDTFTTQELLSHIEPSRLHRIWLRS